MAEVNVRIQQFFNQKPIAIIRFKTIEIWHPQIGTLRFVKDFTDKQLGIESTADRDAGQTVTFSALNFEVADPAQDDTPNALIIIQLGRVGSDVKDKLKLIKDFGFMDSVEVIYRYYLSDDLTAPAKKFKLFGGSVVLSGNNAGITAEDDNPTNQDVSRVYTYEDFPGLETL
jgi:hypothetical protein